MLYRISIRVALVAMITLSLGVQAQSDCNYEERRAEYLENLAETATGMDRLIIQAFNDQPLDEELLILEVESLLTRNTSDFAITMLMRVLYFTDGEYDDQILPTLNEIPFWLPDPEGADRQYWSENHMCMWMSADWLLHEKYGREVRPSLRQMLVKWLDMKIEYGFYEYFSPIYYPFTLTGVLNLVDFAQDEEIQAKAAIVADKLLRDVLLMVNDQGYYFPTCGRGDMGKFETGGIGSIGDLVRYVTGINWDPASNSRGAVALATGSFDVSEICASWSPEVNTTIHYGHPLSEARNIYSELTKEDRIIFQWSSGAYFHPLVAQETLWQVGNFQLWQHEEFAEFAFAQFLPASIGNVFAKIAASITRSSYIGNVEIDIFKNEGIVLNSSQDMWKGRAGYQIYPVIATVESNPVLLRSGEVFPEWSMVPSRRSNDHLPYVDQDENVALVMYKPNLDLPLWGFGNREVALKWQDEAFEEQRAFDNWQLGRIDDSYIAVKKHCDEFINGIPACPDADGQTWAIIVGNENMHGSFDGFEAMVREAEYEERWYFNWQRLKWVYYGRITADGKNIDHHWLGNIWDAPDMSDGRVEDGRIGQFETDKVNVFPNPAKDFVVLDLHAYEREVQSIYVINMAGQTVYADGQAGSQDVLYTIETQDWQQGLYTIVLQHEDGSTNVKRLVIAR